MNSYKVNFSRQGQVTLPGNTGKIVAHYVDGHIQVFTLTEFLMKRNKKRIVQIDCYEKGEKISQ